MASVTCSANTLNIPTKTDTIVWTAQTERTRTERRAAGVRLAGNLIQIDLAAGPALVGWCLTMVTRTALYVKGVVLDESQIDQSTWQQTAVFAQPESSARQ